MPFHVYCGFSFTIRDPSGTTVKILECPRTVGSYDMDNIAKVTDLRKELIHGGIR